MNEPELRRYPVRVSAPDQLRGKVLSLECEIRSAEPAEDGTHVITSITPLRAILWDGTPLDLPPFNNMSLLEAQTALAACVSALQEAGAALASMHGLWYAHAGQPHQAAQEAMTHVNAMLGTILPSQAVADVAAMARALAEAANAAVIAHQQAGFDASREQEQWRAVLKRWAGLIPATIMPEWAKDA